MYTMQALQAMRENASKAGTALPAGSFNVEGRSVRTNSLQRDTAGAGAADHRPLAEHGAVGGLHDRGSDGSVSDVRRCSIVYSCGVLACRFNVKYDPSYS